MVYNESYKNLYHGTDEKSADLILKEGFEIRGDENSWCGKGIYFYDIKKKAWWSANRTCTTIKRQTNEKLKSKVLHADIIKVQDSDIMDLRTEKDLMELEKFSRELFGDYKIKLKSDEHDTEKIIKFRSVLIGFSADKLNKKLVIGTFRQRPQPKYEHAIEFANSLDMIFGIETIYCVKDSSIIENVRLGGD